MLVSDQRYDTSSMTLGCLVSKNVTITVATEVCLVRWARVYSACSGHGGSCRMGCGRAIANQKSEIARDCPLDPINLLFYLERDFFVILVSGPTGYYHQHNSDIASVS